MYTNQQIKDKENQINKLMEEITQIKYVELLNRANDPKDVQIVKEQVEIDNVSVERIVQRWTEDFIDEDSGEVVSVERTENLAINGKLCNWQGREIINTIKFGTKLARKPIWKDYKIMKKFIKKPDNTPY